MEETKTCLSRRHFLTKGSTAVGALGLAMSAGSLIMPREAQAALLTFPQPTALDVERVRDLGYYWYKKGPGCGHGSARGLIQGFSEACTAQGLDPLGWNDIPRNLYAWCNGGGPSNWGVLCGSIAGAVGVMNLIGRQGDIGQKVFEWYVKQNFPYANLDDLAIGFDGSANGNGGHGASATGPLTDAQMPIPSAEHKGQAISDSPLCHISVSKWMAAAGVYHGQTDPVSGKDYRGDRCAKVTADTAAYAAEQYNLWKATATLPGSWQKPSAMGSCFDCHDVGGTAGVTNKSSATKMDCLPCHTEPVTGRK